MKHDTHTLPTASVSSTTLSRRAALTGCMALGTTATASCAPHAVVEDAEFMRIATRAQVAQAAFVAFYARWSSVVHIPPDVEAEQDRLFLVADGLRRQAMSMPARTAAGLRAKARMVLDAIGLDDNDVLPPSDQDFPAWSLARDLLGGWA